MATTDQFDVSKIEYLFIRDITCNYSIPRDTSSLIRNKGKINFNVEIEKNISIEDNLIILIFTIHLKTYDANKKEVIATYSTEHLFRIENLQDLIKSKDDLWEVDDLLDNTLSGLAYSTVRGLLYQKFVGTWFATFILPITNPSNLVGTASSNLKEG